MRDEKLVQKKTGLSLENEILRKISSGEVKMKPRFYFWIASLVGFVSLVAFLITTIFLMNLLFFLMRRHGPMGQLRLGYILNSFPLWIPLLALLGFTISIAILRRYDFSYKKNFVVIALLFVFSVIVAGFIVDRSGLNEKWFSRGPMKRFYYQFEKERKQPFDFPHRGGRWRR